MTSTGGAPPEDPRTDAELLAAHVAGDSDAFGLLLTRHRDRLWAVALRTMGNPDDAADGLQDGVIAAFRRASTFRGDAAVTTWLHRVVVNACLDRLRAAKVRRADALPDDLDDHPTRGHLASPDPDPAAHAEASEQRRAVLAALRELPAEQRAALVLVDMEGYAVAEAAAILDCPAGTVKSRCSRGRSRLAELLAPLLASDPRGGPPPGRRNPVPPAPVETTDAPRGPPAPA